MFLAPLSWLVTSWWQAVKQLRVAQLFMLACGPGTSLDLINNYLSVGITWGKVVSLYSVAAGLAVDCVRQAQPAMVHALVDCLGEFVRKTLATWLRRRGGWVSLIVGGAVWWRCWETEGCSGMEDGGSWVRASGLRAALRPRQVLALPSLH